MVSVNNEWGKLRELFVGTIDNATGIINIKGYK
jgi:hypothetical protein